MLFTFWCWSQDISIKLWFGCFSNNQLDVVQIQDRLNTGALICGFTKLHSFTGGMPVANARLVWVGNSLLKKIYNNPGGDCWVGGGYIDPKNLHIWRWNWTLCSSWGIIWVPIITLLHCMRLWLCWTSGRRGPLWFSTVRWHVAGLPASQVGGHVHWDAWDWIWEVVPTECMGWWHYERKQNIQKVFCKLALPWFLKGNRVSLMICCRPAASTLSDLVDRHCL